MPKKQLPKPISEPLVTHIYTADPSAHIFNGRIYIYPSHDIESNTPQDDEGGHFRYEGLSYLIEWIVSVEKLLTMEVALGY
jgi:hypothetical protein